MDRRFLSDAAVVAASRSFICIRLATYESVEEAKFLTALAAGRTSALENAVFVMLAPDGKKALTRPTRSPARLYSSAAEMAKSMAKIAKDVTPTSEPQALPLLADLRRAINVAACDMQPLVATTTKKDAAIKALAWAPAFIGRMAYARVTDLTELKAIEGSDGKAGVYIVQSGVYGLKARVLVKAKSNSRVDLEAALTEALKKFTAEGKDQRKHIRTGRRSGATWKPVIEKTDPGPRRGRR